MPGDVFVVDAGHLFAASGRSLGLGAQRVSGRFEPSRLVDAILRLSPRPDGRVLWFDAAAEGHLTAEQRAVRDDSRVEFHVLPLKSGKQRHVEAAVLLRVTQLAADEGLQHVFLLGDPERHALVTQMAGASALMLTLVGVAGGEKHPATRIWLRRQELVRSLLSRQPAPGRSPAAPGHGYQPPGLVGATRVAPLSRPRPAAPSRP